MQENQLLIDVIKDFLQFIPVTWWERSTYGLSWWELIDGIPVAFEARLIDESRIPELNSEAIHCQVSILDTTQKVEILGECREIQVSHSAAWHLPRQKEVRPEVIGDLETRERCRFLKEPSSEIGSNNEQPLDYPFDFVQSVLMCIPLHRWERQLMDLVWDGEIDGKEFHAEATALEKTEERILVSVSLELSDFSSEMLKSYLKFSSAGSLFELILGKSEPRGLK